MVLKDTTNHLRKLLSNISHDLEKADAGNKAASQRVRTGTVKLEKTAKLYRKESIQSERKTKGTKKSVKKAAPKAKAKAHATKAHAPKAHAPKAKAHATKAHAPKAKAHAVKAKPKAKSHKTTAKPRALAFKKPTAKIPHKKAKAKSWLGKMF